MTIVESCIGGCGATGPVPPGHPRIAAYLCPACRAEGWSNEVSSWLVTLMYSADGACYPDVARRTREVAASLPTMTMRAEGLAGHERLVIMVTVDGARKSEALSRATERAAALIDLAQLRLLGDER